MWKTQQGEPLNLLISYVQVAYAGGHVAVSGGKRLFWLYDITPLRRAEQARLRSEQRLSEAIESISEGFVCYDGEDPLVILVFILFPDIMLPRPGHQPDCDGAAVESIHAAMRSAGFT